MSLVIFTNHIESSDEFEQAKTNNPILRKQRITEVIKNKIDNTTCIEINEEIDTHWLQCVHETQYINFLKHCYESFINSNDISWQNSDHGLLPCNFYKSKCPSSVPLYKWCGFYGSDTMTPIYANTWHNAAISANQAYLGATYLNKHPTTLIYVLATSPGHHAKTAEYGGYCFINNAMVAAKRLQELSKLKTIGILDLDYHAGNGTNEIVMNGTNDDIYAYSIHCNPIYEYPSFDGFADRYNYPLEPHCEWSTYECTLEVVCQKMYDHGIDSLIIAFGGDTFKDDPDAIPIGRFNLDLEAYNKMGQIIKKYFPEIPKMITQEGGYNMDYIGEIVTSFMQGLK
jgi:acetoin utilization deacetylase AcuC-like enzyme